METKAVNNKPSKPFIIANTIYDTALVRLMENQQIAKFFISTILEQPVEEFVRIIIHQTGENCEFFLQKTVFRPIVIAGSAATKQSGKSCISGLLRRYAPRNDDPSRIASSHIQLTKLHRARNNNIKYPVKY